MQNGIPCGLVLLVLSLGGCDTPLHGDSRRDAGVKWDSEANSDGDFNWDSSANSDSDFKWEGGSIATPDDLELEDADGAFQVDMDGIWRTGNEPSRSSNRHYMRTVQSDFIASDWACQITFHTPANSPDDILFIGLGEAVPDSSFLSEPRNSLNFRIHQGATGFGVSWRVDVVAHDTGSMHWTYSNQGVGSLPSASGGTFTAQIRKIGSQTIFEILNAAIVVTIPDIGAAAPFLYTSPSRIFFGNASGAYVFDNPRMITGQ